MVNAAVVEPGIPDMGPTNPASDQRRGPARQRGVGTVGLEAMRP
jgi:hypothetical protein